jgi:hypothetical protein
MDGSIIFGLLFWIIIIYLIVRKRVMRSKPPILIKPQNQSPVQTPTVTPKYQQNTLLSEQQEMARWVQYEINKLNKSQSFYHLVKSRDIDLITYNDMLNCFEWKFKRLKILLRDSYQCLDCKTINLSNHVHHTFYIKNKTPWDTEDSALVTLCDKCHSDRHKNEMITIYRLYKGKLIYDSKEYCSRCGGTGYLPQYSHIEGGICFKCWGNKLSQQNFISLLQKAKPRVNSYRDDILRYKYISYLENLKIEDFRKVPKN